MTTIRTTLANLLHSLAVRVAPTGWKPPSGNLAGGNGDTP